MGAIVYLIRHARTAQNAGVPVDEWTLSEDGFVAAAALAGKQFWMTVEQVITSCELKTSATVAPALELWDIPHEAWSEFDEVKRGGYSPSQAEYEARVHRLFAAPDRGDDGWESASDALRRGMEGLSRALGGYPGQNLAIAGHGLMWALVRAHLLGKGEVEPREWKAVGFPDVSMWRVENNEWQLVQDFEGIRKLR